MAPLNFLLAGAFFLSYAALAASPEEISQSVYWHKLLQYKDCPRCESMADGPDFFLAPDGKTNPLAELQADIAAFTAPAAPHGRLKLDPQCAFPERFRYLNEALALAIPSRPCPDFKEWKEGIGAHSVSLIFSSSYPNNPASLFGHTLLRLNRRKSSDLLDYGVNFAAEMPENVGSFEYVIYGLMGGFPGMYSLSPYYEKVNEYSNSESRDIWEYPLALAPEEVDRMVNALWELYANTYFDYYFLSENCSYQLLNLLEVARPDWNLSDSFPWYVIPSDTIHVLKRVGAIAGAPMLRPSSRKLYQQRRDSLSTEEREEMYSVLGGGSTQSRNVLDAAIAFFHYKKFQTKNLADSEPAKRERELLRQRALLGGMSDRPTALLSQNSRPDLGHFSSSWGPSAGFRRGQPTLGLFYRIGVHNLIQNDLGFASFQQIDLGHVNVLYEAKAKRFRLNGVKIADVVSLAAWERFDPKISWHLGLQVDPVEKVFCDNCQRLAGSAGAGWANELVSERLMVYQLFQAHAEWSSHFSPRNFFLGPGLRQGFLWSMGRAYKMQVEGLFRYDLFKSFGKGEDFQFSWNQSLRLSQSHDLQTSVKKHERLRDVEEWQGELRWHRYF